MHALMWYPWCRYEDQFVVASFDNAPTADSEAYSKLDKLVRDEQEAKVSHVEVGPVTADWSCIMMVDLGFQLTFAFLTGMTNMPPC